MCVRNCTLSWKKLINLFRDQCTPGGKIICLLNVDLIEIYIKPTGNEQQQMLLQRNEWCLNHSLACCRCFNGCCNVLCEFEEDTHLQWELESEYGLYQLNCIHVKLPLTANFQLFTVFTFFICFAKLMNRNKSGTECLNWVDSVPAVACSLLTDASFCYRK